MERAARLPSRDRGQADGRPIPVDIGSRYA